MQLQLSFRFSCDFCSDMLVFLEEYEIVSLKKCRLDQFLYLLVLQNMGRYGIRKMTVTGKKNGASPHQVGGGGTN